MKEIFVYEIEDFRRWLEKNHLKESKVKIILHKKHTGENSPTHRKQIEEAIKFGWIDTVVNRIDEDTYSRTFSLRIKNSSWSDNTISYGKELMKAGKMTSQGKKFFEIGLSKPTLDFGIPKNPNQPKELTLALKKNKSAEKNFKNIAPSTKKFLFRWILRAKREETKEKRIKKIIQDYE